VTPIWDSRSHFYYCHIVAGLFMWGTISEQDASVVYNCCRPSPAQSYTDPSPAGIMTIFYCLRFESTPYLYHPGSGWPSYNPRQWISFSSPPTNPRAAVEVFEPGSTMGIGEWLASPPAALSQGKQSPVPIEQKASWAPEPVWPLWRTKKSLFPCYESNSSRSVRSYTH
jgi:hypothetical protein